MGKLTCGCLNVKIHTKSDDLIPTDVAQLGISPPNHEFFRDVAEVHLNLEGITTEHKCLLRAETLPADWTLFQCVNCKAWTHASQASNRLLVSTTHLRHDATLIARLEQSPEFSPLYRIVLQPRDDNTPIKNLSVHSGKYESLQASLATIQQQLTKFLVTEKAHTEQRIRDFEEAQRDTLTQLESKARRDKNTLINVLLAAEEGNTAAAVTAAPTAPVTAAPITAALSRGDARRKAPAAVVSAAPAPLSTAPTTRAAAGGGKPSKPRSALSSRLTGGGGGGGGGREKRTRDLDSEDMFSFDPTFEDAEEPRSFYVSDDDDETEDTDDSEPDVRGGSSGGGRAALYSASVPVTVPMWGTMPASAGFGAHPASRRSLEVDIDDDLLPPEDMAASIKAMARSVHADGTEMFGDLPRSRFKTEFGKL